jgi:hypothetical protein
VPLPPAWVRQNHQTLTLVPLPLAYQTLAQVLAWVRQNHQTLTLVPLPPACQTLAQVLAWARYCC